MLADKGALMERASRRRTPASARGSRSSRRPAPSAPSARWSTDLGQVFNPPVEDGLAIMADEFLGAGFTEDEVRTMAVDNSRRVAGV